MDATVDSSSSISLPKDMDDVDLRCGDVEDILDLEFGILLRRAYVVDTLTRAILQIVFRLSEKRC